MLQPAAGTKHREKKPQHPRDLRADRAKRSVNCQKSQTYFKTPLAFERPEQLRCSSRNKAWGRSAQKSPFTKPEELRGCRRSLTPLACRGSERRGNESHGQRPAAPLGARRPPPGPAAPRRAPPRRGGGGGGSVAAAARQGSPQLRRRTWRAGRGGGTARSPPLPVSPNPAAVRRWEPQPPPGYAAPGQPAPFRDKSKLVTASYGRWRGGGESSPEGKWPQRAGIAISCPAGPGKPLPRGREQPGALQNLRP